MTMFTPVRNMAPLRWTTAAVSVALATCTLVGLTGVTAEAAGRAPAAGSYSGTNPQNGGEPGFSFYVSSDGAQVQDIFVQWTELTCTPGDFTVVDHMGIASAMVTSGASFAATATQHGIYQNGTGDYKATYTYAFKGRFTGVSSSGAAEAKGSYSETLAYSASAKEICRTNTQTWIATRDTQPVQTTSPPPAGSYAGTNAQNGGEPGLSFYVSSTRKTLQDIFVPWTYLACAPGDTTIVNQIGIASATIAAGGSFKGTATQQGDYAGHAATFTYSFDGTFHSVGPSGAERAAGSYMETISYTSSAKTACTTDEQWWSATRDTQPVQTTSPPPAGSYAGTNAQNGGEPGFSFDVSTHHTQIQDISVPWTFLTCSPGGATGMSDIPSGSATLNSDGSFGANWKMLGTYDGHNATFHYIFGGTFHSVGGPSGVERAAGSYSETVTYTGSAKTTCTTDDQWWTAYLSSPA
jgi:hypothetical protein